MEYILFSLMFILTIFGKDKSMTNAAAKDGQVEFIEICINELELDKKKVDYKGGFNNLKDLNPDEKCLLRCILEKMKYITSDGKPVPETIKTLFPDGAKVDLKKCTLSKPMNVCETGYVMARCLHELLIEAVNKDGA